MREQSLYADARYLPIAPAYRPDARWIHIVGLTGDPVSVTDSVGVEHFSITRHERRVISYPLAGELLYLRSAGRSVVTFCTLWPNRTALPLVFAGG
jgi:hypothetical protein